MVERRFARTPLGIRDRGYLPPTAESERTKRGGKQDHNRYENQVRRRLSRPAVRIRVGN